MKKNKCALILIFFSIAFIAWDKKILTAEDASAEASLKPDNVEYKAEGLRDPFREYPKVEIIAGAPEAQKERETTLAEQPLPALTIQGIVWGGNIVQAIINNQVVKIGDALEGVRIVDINQQGVTLFFGSRQYSLPSPATMTLSQEPKKE